MIGSCNNYSINKTNFAITTSNNLTTLQHKFYNHTLFEQEEQGWDTNIIKLHIRDINNLIGNGKHRQNHNKIKSIFKQLLTKELKIVNTKYLNYEATCYLSYVKICDDYIEVKIDDELKKHLNVNYVNEQGIKNTSKGYTCLDLNIVNTLHGTHDISLYQFFTKIMNEQKYKQDCLLDINLLREVASCKNSYKEFKEFKRSILDPSIAKINEKTDINVEYEKIMYAGKVEQIALKITKKANPIAIPQKQKIINNLIERTEPKNNTLELIPESLKEAKEWGYNNMKQLFAMYNNSEETKYQILAILAQISLDYADKANEDKCKLLYSLVKKDAHKDYKAIHDAKLERQNTVIIQKQEIEKQNIEQEKISNEQENKKVQAKEIFEAEIIEGKTQLAQIWASVEKLVEQNFNNNIIKTWFKPAIAKLENGTLNIILPNRFKLDYFNNNIKNYVVNALHRLQLDFKINCVLV